MSGKMKKALTLALAFVMTTIFFIGCSSNGTSEGGGASGGSDASGVTSAGPTGEPIKVGVLIPLSGTSNWAMLGAAGRAGIEMAFEKVDYTIAGRPVEVFFEDTQGDSNQCVQKAQRLIEREGCNIILGPLSGGEGMAIKEFGGSNPDVTIVVAGAASEDITMRGTYPNVFRSSYTGAQVTFKFGDYAYNELGYRDVITIAIDNDFQYTQISGFATSFILAGGNIQNRLWLPVSGNDYSSVIAQIPESIDAVFVCAGGGQATDFLRQFAEYGLVGKVGVLGGSTMCDSTILSSSTGQYLEGVTSGSHFSNTLTHPEFVEFNNAYKERMGMNASLFAADYYTSADCIIRALEANGGKDDVESLCAALREVEFMGVRGPFRFDDYQNVVLTAYINKVERVDGELVNVMQYSYPDQTQFGPFDPEWYQAQPAADRDNPTRETILNAVFAE